MNPKWWKILLSQGGYDAYTNAYVNGMQTKPSTPFIKVIDELVKDREVVNGATITMKQIIALGDVVYLGNINDSNDSFRNLVKNAHHGTKQGSGLVWDAYWGYSNPLGTGYVDTNYNPSTQRVNYSLNNCAMGSFFTRSIVNSQYYMGAYSGPSAMIGKGATGYFSSAINSATASHTTPVPFNDGFFISKRTANNIEENLNQNFAKSSFTKNSSSIPIRNFYLFGYNNNNNGLGLPFTGGLNFTYIGAALTDDQFTALNIMVNRYYKKCLYLKYGADNWGVQMAKSYFDTLHNFEPYEAWEIYEFIKRHQSDYTVILPTVSAINGGKSDTTDWVDSNADGLADSWSLSDSVNKVASIVNGNGFTGNAQKVLSNNATTINLYKGDILLQSKTYVIKCKYRANSGLIVSGATTNAPQNIGNAVDFTFIISNRTNLQFGAGSGVGNWIEIDEVSYQEKPETGYYYNTFGPSGQNKTICDYIMLFKAGGNLAANAWTKTGTTLRWNQDGQIISSNTMPAYTRGTNLGIVTVSSTDGWNGVTGIVLTQTYNSVNSFFGNCPRFFGVLKTGGTKASHISFNNHQKTDYSNLDLINTLSGITTTPQYPGCIKFRLADIIGGAYPQGINIQPADLTSNKIEGSMDSITSEFSTFNSIITKSKGITGSLANMIIANAINNIDFGYNGISSGTSTWNKNLVTCYLNDNNFSIAAVNNQYLVIDNYYVGAVVPIKSTTVAMSGAGMGTPTGGNSNTNRLSIMAKYVAAGWVATLTNNT